MAHKIYGQNQVVVGLTFPLITDQHGKKFGKSENNALFLNPKLTHPYVIYQFLVQTNDADLAKYFRSLTLLDLTVIQGIITQTSHDRKKISGQVVLAWQVVSDLYGKRVADHCLTLAYKLFYAN